MIDRRRVMTPSAHNGNIRRAQLRGVVTNDPRGAAHLPPVSRRERETLFLFISRLHPTSRDAILLNSSRSRLMGCLYTEVRELFHSLNPSGAVANTMALPRETLRRQLRGPLIPGREKGVPFTRRLYHLLFPSLLLPFSSNRRFFLSTLLSCADRAYESLSALVKAPGITWRCMVDR